MSDAAAADPPPSTRDRLLDLAAEAFVEQGYAKVSVRQLAKRTNMTSGAIYGNFDSKSDLLMEVIDARIHQQLEVLPRPDADRLAEVLTDMYEAYRDRREMRALLLEGAVAARSDPDARRRLRDGQLADLDRWSEAYRSLQEQGDISPDLDAAAVLRILWALEVGIGVLEAMEIDLPAPKQTGEIVGRMVEGLADPRRRRRRRKDRAGTT